MIPGIAGYHFDVQFGPLWPALMPLVTERARAVGISVSDDGYAQLRSRALMLRVAGTYWAGLRTGEVHFQIFEFRNDLDGYLLQEACLTSREMLSSFGLKEEMKGWISNRLDKAVGLWIRDGSLVLHEWKDDRGSASEQLLASFDMWRALDAMARLATGEAAFGSPLGSAGKRTQYPTQAWATDFETTATVAPAKATAAFTSKTLSVAAAVTVMQRSE